MDEKIIKFLASLDEEERELIFSNTLLTVDKILTILNFDESKQTKKNIHNLCDFICGVLVLSQYDVDKE